MTRFGENWLRSDVLITLHGAPWESMRTFPMCTGGLARCRSRLAWRRGGYTRLCTKLQLSGPTGTACTSYGPGCLVLGRLELLAAAGRRTAAAHTGNFWRLTWSNWSITLHLGNLYYFRMLDEGQDLQPRPHRRSYSSNFEASKANVNFPHLKARRW